MLTLFISCLASHGIEAGGEGFDALIFGVFVSCWLPNGDALQQHSSFNRGLLRFAMVTGTRKPSFLVFFLLN